MKTKIKVNVIVLDTFYPGLFMCILHKLFHVGSFSNKNQR